MAQWPKRKPSAGAIQYLAEAERLNAEVSRLTGAGEYDDAMPLAKRALAIREKALGPDIRMSPVAQQPRVALRQKGRLRTGRAALSARPGH